MRCRRFENSKTPFLPLKIIVILLLLILAMYYGNHSIFSSFESADRTSIKRLARVFLGSRICLMSSILAIYSVLADCRKLKRHTHDPTSLSKRGKCCGFFFFTIILTLLCFLLSAHFIFHLPPAGPHF